MMKIKKSVLPLSAIAIMSVLNFSACENTLRYDENSKGIILDNPAGTISNLPNKSDDNSSTISDNPDTIVIDDGNLSTPDQNVTIKSADNVYQIHISPERDALNRNQAQKIHYEIKDLFTDAAADDASIEKIEFTVDDNFAKFVNYKGEEGDTFTFLGDSAKSSGDVAIKSVNNSGQVNVNFAVTINGITNAMTKSFPVVIINNQSSSISMIPVPKYAEYDKYENGLYVDKFTLHVVDKYGNKAKDGTFVHVGVVNNLKQDNGINLYTPQLATTGKLTTKANTFTFDNNLVLSNVNSNNELAVDDKDTVVVLPNGLRSDPRYLGGWRVKQVENGDDTLSLWDTFTWDENKTGLSFAIGDDKKFNSCDQTLASAAIYSDTDYKVKDGIVNVELRYGPYMIGKSVFLYANSLIDGERIGISRKVDLEGTGIEDMTYTCDASDSNISVACNWTGYLKFNDSGEDVKHVNVGRRFTEYGAVGAANRLIACDSASHELIIAPAGKKVSVTVKYVIESELP